MGVGEVALGGGRGATWRKLSRKGRFLTLLSYLRWMYEGGRREVRLRRQVVNIENAREE